MLPVEGYDDARGLASLYLLAGSSKGARVLLRGLPDHVGPAARTGLTDASSRDSARLWGAVVTALGEPLERSPRHLPRPRRGRRRAGRRRLHRPSTRLVVEDRTVMAG